MKSLIEKYNTSGPRYTSYPPVPFWRETPSEDLWIKHVKEKYSEKTGLDLYVHVPFCESLCYYCGCNRIITKNHSEEESFIHALLAEWTLYKQKLGFTPVISSLHFGGGTPTFLSPKHLDKLIKALTERQTSTFIGSIEVDPRTCTGEHIQTLKQNGIKRFSLGIQDFDPAVQKAIHREQSPSMVDSLVKEMRDHGVNSINFDLIYGLPEQSLKSIEQTINIVSEMRPDLIAFYSYAHLPEKIKNQRLIQSKALPSAELKRELYEKGKKELLAQGYCDVGMDHFALPSSYLSKAKESNQLQRNFMGYVDKKSSVLIGLGPTAISDSSLSFLQNSKDLSSYKEKINRGQLPLEKGHTHQEKDLVVQQAIQELMCNNEVQITNWDKIPYRSDIQKELADFEADGLLMRHENKITLTDIGKIFMRNVAMSFDFYLRDQQHSKMFSQTI